MTEGGHSAEPQCAPGKRPASSQRTEPAPVIDAGIQQRCPAVLQALSGVSARLDWRQVGRRLRRAASARPGKACGCLHTHPLTDDWCAYHSVTCPGIVADLTPGCWRRAPV
jgi:hypothetical protein